MQVPRRIGQDDNQVIAKIDTQLTQNNQVSARYFFDHFTNDPTLSLTGGGPDGQNPNLLSYRGPTLGSRQRIQNVVGTWQRTMTPTLLNDSASASTSSRRAGIRRRACRACRTSACGCRSIPTLPSISQIEANGFFGIGDNLFASFPRTASKSTTA